MRIAILVKQFPCFSETFVLNQITGLLERGHHVDIFPAEKDEVDKTHPDIEKYDLLSRTHYPLPVGENRVGRVLRSVGGASWRYWRRPGVVWHCLGAKFEQTLTLRTVLLARIVTMANVAPYDIIHGHFGPGGLLGHTLRQMNVLKGKLLTTFYGFDVTRRPRQSGRDVYRRLFESGEHFLVLSQVMRKALIAFGCDPGRVSVHHLGVDCRRFTFQPRRPDSDGTIRLISIARFVEKKGLSYAIAAVAKLVEKHRKIEYVIIGDGELRPQIERQIGELKLSNHVRLLGWQDQSEVVPWLGRAHVFLAPSVTAADGNEEGTPTAIIEAFAMGLPVVATRHSGIPEMVEDGKSGYLVPERDTEALADRLSHVIEHPDRWAEFGRVGRQHVEQHFDIDRLNDHLVNTYQEMLDSDKFKAIDP